VFIVLVSEVRLFQLDDVLLCIINMVNKLIPIKFRELPSCERAPLYLLYYQGHGRTG